MADAFQIVTIAERSDLVDAAYEVTDAAWPEFMLHDAIANDYWYRLYESLQEFQFVLLEPQSDGVIAVGNSIPLDWDGEFRDLPEEGWDWAMQTGFQRPWRAGASGVLCALSITISKPYLGKGLSSRMVQAMRQIGREHGFHSMIAPVRPNLKSLYPLISMQRYIEWQNQDGLPFDPWMRVHARLGAQVIKVCPAAMRIVGSLEEWEAWAGMRFPDDGEYVVPGALVPVTIDHAGDLGEYIEPNVWMHHPIRDA